MNSTPKVENNNLFSISFLLKMKSRKKQMNLKTRRKK